MQNEYHDILVHFTGSIAFFFQEEVKEAALRLNVSIGKEKESDPPESGWLKAVGILYLKSVPGSNRIL